MNWLTKLIENYIFIEYINIYRYRSNLFSEWFKQNWPLTNINKNFINYCVFEDGNIN